MVVYRNERVMVNKPNSAPGSYTDHVDLTDLSSNPAFAAPSRDAPNANTNDGWSPHLYETALGVPDEMRLGRFRRHDFHPDNQELFYDQRDYNTAVRHSVQEIDGDGWFQSPTPVDTPIIPDVRLVPVRSDRWTAYMSPNGSSYNDPTWSNDKAKTFNGVHFSMADHRRTYDIYGMAPAMTRRNTTRVEPGPWDTYLEDKTTEWVPPYMEATSPSVSLSRGRL